MNTEPLRTCTHLHDHGGTCHSVAVRGQRYCPFHLRYRARLMRMAQFRARGQRFDLRLPPLEDMFAVQSALNQLVEAVAADMLDLKRAHFLLKAVRSAAQNLKWADKWPASIAHSEHAADVDLAAEYGLPGDLDLSIPPQVAFPQSVILSEDPERSEGDESKDPFVPAQRLGFDNSPMPTVDYWLVAQVSQSPAVPHVRPSFGLTWVQNCTRSAPSRQPFRTEHLPATGVMGTGSPPRYHTVVCPTPFPASPSACTPAFVRRGIGVPRQAAHMPPATGAL